METKTILSEKFTLQARDFVKSLVMFVLGAVVTFLYEFIQEGSIFDVDYVTVIKVALNAAVVYLFKNWIIEPPKVITIADSNSTAKAVKEHMDSNV